MLFTNKSIGESSENVNVFRQLQQGRSFDPDLGQVAGAFVEESFQGVGTAAADYRANLVEEAEKTGNPLKQEEYQSSPYFREQIEYYDGMTDSAARVLAENQDEVTRRAEIISRASGVETVAGFTAGFLTGMVEPKNAGIGVATAVVGGAIANRVVGAARMARTIEKYGQYRTMAGMGAAEGLVASILAEPSNRESAKILQQDYDMADSLMNVGLSVAFGSLGNVGVAYIGNKIRRNKSSNIVLDELDTATTQLAEGRRIDVTAVEKIHRKTIAPETAEQVIDDIVMRSLRDIEDIQQKKLLDSPEIAELLDQRKALMQEIRQIKKPKSVLRLAQELGLKDEGGFLKANDITNRTLTGVIRKKGMTYDEFGEQLVQQGYFKERPTEAEVIDTLLNESRGEPKIFRQSEEEFEFRRQELERAWDDLDQELLERYDFAPEDAEKLKQLANDIKSNETLDERIAARRAEAEAEVRAIRESIEAVNDPTNSTAVDDLEIQEFDYYKERNPTDDFTKELEEVEASMEAMRAQGLLDEEAEAVITQLNEVDIDDITNGYNAAYICMTRG